MISAVQPDLQASSEVRQSMGSSPPDPGAVASLDPANIAKIAAVQKSRILVVEDNPFVREGVIRLVNRQMDLICCGEADTIAATPSLVAREKPNLVLLDLRLKDGECFDLLDMLRIEFPGVPTLILSQCDEALYAERALRAGAKGYVMKQEAGGEVLEAIRAVLLGKIYVSREMAGRLLHKLLRNQT